MAVTCHCAKVTEQRRARGEGRETRERLRRNAADSQVPREHLDDIDIEEAEGEHGYQVLGIGGPWRNLTPTFVETLHKISHSCCGGRGAFLVFAALRSRVMKRQCTQTKQSPVRAQSTLYDRALRLTKLNRSVRSNLEPVCGRRRGAWRPPLSTRQHFELRD